MPTISNRKPRAAFYGGDAVAFMERAGKLQGLADPTDIFAEILLLADQLGRLGECPLTRRERVELELLAQTPLNFHGYYPVQKHHINGDRSDNRRENLAVLFSFTHEALSDPREGPSRFLRRLQVGAIWHERLRANGIDAIWLPPVRTVKITLPPITIDEFDEVGEFDD